MPGKVAPQKKRKTAQPGKFEADRLAEYKEEAAASHADGDWLMTTLATNLSKHGGWEEYILFASRYPTSQSMGSGLYEITGSIACSLARFTLMQERSARGEACDSRKGEANFGRHGHLRKQLYHI